MATRPTSLELQRYTARRKQLQDQSDPTVLRLFRFLESVWDYTSGKPSNQQTIYGLYCGKLPPRPVTERAPSTALFDPIRAEFFTRAQQRSRVCNGNLELPKEAVVVVINQNLEFRTPCGQDQVAITDRLYINVKMEHAIDVMRFIAFEIVLGGAGVVYAKIADPLDLCLPLFDRIVIYCGAKDAAKLAARRISTQFPSTCFNPETPAMTKVLSTGISTGAEPRQVKATLTAGFKMGEGGDQSFGTKRASLICAALQSCGGDKERFFAEVSSKFVEFNVDPNKPHRNLPDA